MTLLAPVLSTADLQADHNWSANLATLADSHPDLVEILREIPIDLTWLFARDGSLTAMTHAGLWWADCSVPLLAGRALLKSLESNSLMSCYLCPAHAGLVRAARERTGDEPAMLAVVPDPLTLRVMLASHDFSSEIESHHLWFAAGDSWPEQVLRLLQNHPGLPTPARFIRTKLTPDDVIEPMIAEAQAVFSSILTERTKRIEAIRALPRSPSANDRLLIIAGSRFRLWDDAASVLSDELHALIDADRLAKSIDHFDSDNPATSSPLAFAEAAASVGAVVAANVSRADATNLVPLEIPWLTWITRPQLPPFTTAGPRDALILADPAWQKSAAAAGWPAARVKLADWPAFKLPPVFDPQRSLALIADTRAIEIPPSVEDLSSHRVLWDQIEAELHDDPLALGDDLNRFIDDRAARLDIDPQTIERRRFLEDLILPAYQQGIARLLLSAGIPLRLHGAAWNQLDEFRAAASGPIQNRAAFLTAAASAAALVYAWPIRHAHAIDALSKPVLHRTGRRKESFLRDAKLAITASSPKPSGLPSSVSDAVASLLGFECA